MLPTVYYSISPRFVALLFGLDFFFLLAHQSLNNAGNQEIWKRILEKEGIILLFLCSLSLDS